MKAVNCNFCPEGSGKSIIFSPGTYGVELSFNVVAVPSFQGFGVIQIHAWNQKPNKFLNGRIWYKELPEGGGIFTITPALDKIGISIFQRNPSRNFWDCVCCELNNISNQITLKSF